MPIDVIVFGAVGTRLNYAQHCLIRKLVYELPVSRDLSTAIHARMHVTPGFAENIRRQPSERMPAVSGRLNESLELFVVNMLIDWTPQNLALLL
jgi:hypothetical protein